VAELIEAGQWLRQAQRTALEGDATELREAAPAERAIVKRLTGDAAKLAADEGQAVSPAMRERIAETLRTAAVDGKAQALLAAGRLTEELEPGGFDALAAFGPVKRRPAAAAKPKPDPKEAEKRAERKRALTDAQKQVRELRAELKRREDEAAAAARRLRGAERKLRELEP
jgi:hypothetical protein